MKRLERISSRSGTRFIDVVQTEDGSYVLQTFVRKYDSEEEQTYEVRELPDPTGRYAELNAAIIEAKRLLESR